eukprot:365985-Chlamydomonas_euryale.AAC.6
MLTHTYSKCIVCARCHWSLSGFKREWPPVKLPFVMAGGYLVELTSGGLCLATFTEPLHAVAWSVCLVEVLKVGGVCVTEAKCGAQLIQTRMGCYSCVALQRGAVTFTAEHRDRLYGEAAADPERDCSSSTQRWSVRRSSKHAAGGGA